MMGPGAGIGAAPGAAFPAGPGYYQQGGAFAAPSGMAPGPGAGMLRMGSSGYQGLESSPALMMPSAGMVAFQGRQAERRAGSRMSVGAVGAGGGARPMGPGAMGAMGVAQAPGVAVAPPAQAFPGGGGAPVWALPIWFDLRTDVYGQPEVEYIYWKGGDVVVGLVCDSRGYITAVAVAGRECAFARTALGDAKRTIKLGDGFKLVIYRYGYPDRIETFNGGGAGTPFSGSVSFQGTTNAFERDCILYYDQETPDGKQKNVAFTLHDMVVTRVHIWIPTEF